MVTGACGATFSFVVTLRYAYKGEAGLAIYGSTPMAFSTAVLLMIYGIAIFWDGWLSREQTIVRPQSSGFTSHQFIQIALAILTSLTMVIVALIGALK